MGESLTLEQEGLDGQVVPAASQCGTSLPSRDRACLPSGTAERQAKKEVLRVARAATSYRVPKAIPGDDGLALRSYPSHSSRHSEMSLPF